MIKKLFAVLVLLIMCTYIFKPYVSAAEVTADNVNFIKVENSSSDYMINMNRVNTYAALRIQPDLNVFVEGILKIIYKIVPIQLADGTLKVSPKEMKRGRQY